MFESLPPTITYAGYFLLGLTVPFACYFSMLQLFVRKTVARVITYMMMIIFFANLEAFWGFVYVSCAYFAIAGGYGFYKGTLTRDMIFAFFRDVWGFLAEGKGIFRKIWQGINAWLGRHRIIRLLLIIGLPLWGMAYVTEQHREEKQAAFRENPQVILAPIEQMVEKKQFRKAIDEAERHTTWISDSRLNALYEKAVLGLVGRLTRDDLNTLREKRDLYEKIAGIKAEHRDRFEELNDQYEMKKALKDGPENARYACKLAVKSQSKFPDEADFIGSARMERTGDITEVRGTVKLMNGLGNMIPHDYYCKFNGLTLSIARVDW